MAAKVTERLSEMSDIVGVLEAWEATNQGAEAEGAYDSVSMDWNVGRSADFCLHPLCFWAGL